MGYFSIRFPHFHVTAAVLAALFIGLNADNSDYTFPGCDPLAPEDFRTVTLIKKGTGGSPLVLDPSLLEPIDLELVQDDNGNINVFFVERRGNVKFLDVANKSFKIAATIDVVTTNQNHGLVGIVKDPNYKENRWMYLYYSHDDLDMARLARFVVKPDNTLDMQTEKPILQFPVIDQSGVYHTGGGIYFDSFGDLWLSVGDFNGLGDFCSTDNPKSSGEDGPSSTGSFLGSIIRIRPIPFPDSETPEPGPGSTYDLVEGNFGEHFAEYFEAEGKSALAEQYRDHSLVKPEIFAKGLRNPYSIALHPVRRWVGWGDYGPDVSGDLETEEHNLITEPAFMGWPYFAGANKSLNCDKDELAPTNTNPLNTGVTELPPATPAIRPYPRACAMSGPIYQYDGDLQSDTKFPPHFNNIWFVMEWNQGWLHGVRLDETGKELQQDDEVFENLHFDHPTSARIGPEGALYVVNYASSWYNSNGETNIARVDYLGDCLPDEPKLETVGCMDPLFEEYDPNAVVEPEGACLILKVKDGYLQKIKGVSITSRAVSITRAGEHSLEVYNTTGEKQFSARNSEAKEYSFSAIRSGSAIRRGMYLVRVKVGEERTVAKVLLP